VKAARESKQQTSWLAPNEGYEVGLQRFVARLLDPSHSQRFIASFEALARRAALMGALNSLTQVTLKTAVPGVPDFYQGTELWDLSLVDPDNRRPVDMGARASLLSSLDETPDWRALARSWPNGHIKFALMRHHLALRQQLQDVFANGSYRPLEVAGPHANEVIAFARISGRNAVIVAGGRLFARATDSGRRWPSGEDWTASLSLDDFADIRNVLTGDEKITGPSVAVSQLFDALPVMLLRAQHAPTRPTPPANRGKPELAHSAPVRV
jgi:(1->4)-alpha-D-glucan 1-alpha-D-glucosylmutase